MICFSCADVNFNLKQKLVLKKWLKEVAASRGYKIGEFNYIFCSDNYLLDVNKRFLGHDYYTDIITFDMSDEAEQGGSPFTGGSSSKGKLVCGEVYISIDTVRTNGEQYGEGFERELHRVIIHGLLHLVGYDDVTPVLQVEMTAAENGALELLSKMMLKRDE